MKNLSRKQNGEENGVKKLRENMEKNFFFEKIEKKVDRQGFFMN